jgi:hypothetical protein
LTRSSTQLDRLIENPQFVNNLDVLTIFKLRLCTSQLITFIVIVQANPLIPQLKMALAASLGAGSLIQLGVSLGDIAVLVQGGRRLGNWLFVDKHDDDLFNSINELPIAVLKRRGLINPTRMESLWSTVEILYQGRRINTANQHTRDDQRLSDFSWLMVAITSGLGWCLADSTSRQLLTEIFVNILNGGEKSENQEQSIRAQLPTNLASWKSLASAKGMDRGALTAMKKIRAKLAGNSSGQDVAIPQLNRRELDELKSFLHWLLAEPENYEFRTFSMMVYLLAAALERVGVHISTEGRRTYETQPLVHYAEPGVNSIQDPIWYYNTDNPQNARRTVQLRAQQIAYPYNKPEAMIETVPLPRNVRNDMELLWELGANAGAKVKLTASALTPFTSASDIDYTVESFDIPTSKFDTALSLLAGHAFPVVSQSVLVALETLTKGLSPTRVEWLHRYTAVEYLTRQTTAPSNRKENIEIFQKYAALVFGFYYQLLRPWVSFQYLESDAYLRGIWGDGSPLFLAMCTRFADDLSRNGKTSRSHILHLLGSMYGGRQKMYSPTSSTSGLLGILGPASVLTMSLVCVTDVPADIAKFVVINLPIIDLMSDTNGELYSNNDSGIDFFSNMKPGAKVSPRLCTKSWAVDAKMGMLFGEGETGVTMAARCEGRLAGWFSPLAADVAFISSCYVAPRDDEVQQEQAIKGFEVTDEQWQASRVQLPSPADTVSEDQMLLVQSQGCPALRYAAAGFYSSAGQEVAIATNDIVAAFGRLEAQGPGVIIA